MSHEVTAPLPLTHVDLGPDVVRAALDGVTPLHELRVAVSLGYAEIQGLRSIERASGLSRDSVLAVLPSEGEVTTLLHCSSRGRFTWDEDEREVMQISRRTDLDHSDTSLLFNPLSVQEGWVPMTLLKEKIRKDDSTSGREVTAVSELLNPALDIWSNTGGDLEFGDAGWVLALVTGFLRVTFAPAEIARITRLGERQVRRLVAKLEKWNLASRERHGREVRITVDFSVMALDGETLEAFTKTNRLAHKSQEHQLEAESVSVMGTDQGRTVRHMVKNAATELRMLKEWAKETGSRSWDHLIEVLEKRLRPKGRRISRWTAEHLILRDLGPIRA